MRRALVSGIGLALVAGLVTVFSDLLSLAAAWPLLLGAAVALVPGARAAQRAGAVAVGLAAAWVGYALRAGFLPDLPSGRGVAIAVSVLIVTGVAVASADRLPLWAGLAGLAAFAGGYEATYVASPTDFATTSVTAATSVLLATALGMLAATALQIAPVTDPEEDAASADRAPAGAEGI